MATQHGTATQQQRNARYRQTTRTAIANESGRFVSKHNTVQRCNSSEIPTNDSAVGGAEKACNANCVLVYRVIIKRTPLHLTITNAEGSRLGSYGKTIQIVEDSRG